MKRYFMFAIIVLAITHFGLYKLTMVNEVFYSEAPILPELDNQYVQSDILYETDQGAPFELKSFFGEH